MYGWHVSCRVVDGLKKMGCWWTISQQTVCITKMSCQDAWSKHSMESCSKSHYFFSFLKVSLDVEWHIRSYYDFDASSVKNNSMIPSWRWRHDFNTSNVYRWKRWRFEFEIFISKVHELSIIYDDGDRVTSRLLCYWSNVYFALSKLLLHWKSERRKFSSFLLFLVTISLTC